MPYLRIAIGIRTPHRSMNAAGLYLGTDANMLQAAIDAAPPEFQRFEIGIFQFQRKGLRKGDAASARATIAAAERETEEDGNTPFDGPSAADWDAALKRIAELEGLLAAAGKQLTPEPSVPAAQNSPTQENQPEAVPSAPAAGDAKAPAADTPGAATEVLPLAPDDDGPTLAGGNSPKNVRRK